MSWPVQTVAGSGLAGDGKKREGGESGREKDKEEKRKKERKRKKRKEKEKERKYPGLARDFDFSIFISSSRFSNLISFFSKTQIRVFHLLKKYDTITNF